MKISDIIEGLVTTIPYYNDPQGDHLVFVSNDEIHLRPTDRSMSEKDVRKMWSLGWIQFGVHNDDEYDSREKWSIFD